MYDGRPRPSEYGKDAQRTKEQRSTSVVRRLLAVAKLAMPIEAHKKRPFGLPPEPRAMWRSLITHRQDARLRLRTPAAANGFAMKNVVRSMSRWTRRRSPAAIGGHLKFRRYQRRNCREIGRANRVGIVRRISGSAEARNADHRPGDFSCTFDERRPDNSDAMTGRRAIGNRLAICCRWPPDANCHPC